MNPALHSHPGTPDQGQQSRAPLGGIMSHCAFRAGCSWAEARHSVKQAELPAASSKGHLTPLFNPLKTTETLKLLNKMFLNVPLKKCSLLVLVCAQVFKKNEALSPSDYALYTPCSAFPWICLMEPSPGSQLKVTPALEARVPSSQPFACLAPLPHPLTQVNF